MPICSSLLLADWEARQAGGQAGRRGGRKAERREGRKEGGREGEREAVGEAGGGVNGEEGGEVNGVEGGEDRWARCSTPGPPPAAVGSSLRQGLHPCVSYLVAAREVHLLQPPRASPCSAPHPCVRHLEQVSFVRVHISQMRAGGEAAVSCACRRCFFEVLPCVRRGAPPPAQPASAAFARRPSRGGSSRGRRRDDGRQARVCVASGLAKKRAQFWED